jgi:ABC-type glycerol-3-phosphate transport system substrate-binding protein
MHRNGRHRNFRRMVLSAVIMCLLTFPLYGCNSPEPTLEPMAITFAHQDSDSDYFQALAREFQEDHPNIAVEVQESRTEFTDCFKDLPYDLKQWRERAEILSLDPVMEQDESFDLDAFYPSTVQTFSSQGKIWAVPAGVNVAVLYYNKDLFDSYEVAYPQPGWTWTDFLDTALALRDPDAQVFGYVIPQGGNAFDPLLFVYQHGGSLFDDMQNPSHTTFDDPFTIEALEWYAKLINEHNVAPTPQQIREFYGGTTNALYRGLLQSKFAMWIGWYNERGGLVWPVEWPMRWGMVPLPRDEAFFTGGMVEGYFISADTQRAAACWEWISFLSRQVPPSALPARRSLAESEVYEAQVGSEIAKVGRVSLENALLISPELSELEPALEIFSKALDDIINQRVTVADAMDNAQREAEALEP